MVTLAPRGRAPFDVVVIASSVGGLSAMRQVLLDIPADFRAPIVLIQHLAPTKPSFLPHLLMAGTPLVVRHATEGEALRAGTVLIAPPGRHLVLRASGYCHLSDELPIHFNRPSADALFESAALMPGWRTLGVVLTGNLGDGAAGASLIRARGGVVIAQDPATCIAPGMPSAAIARGAVDYVLPLDEIGAVIARFVLTGDPRHARKSNTAHRNASDRDREPA